MSSIPDITETEVWTVESTLKERWTDRTVEVQLADVEIKLHPGDRDTTECPAIFWQVDDANFIIVKVAEKIYRSQFYYRGFQQYGTGKPEFDDLTDCVMTMLQVHADKESMNREESENENK